MSDVYNLKLHNKCDKNLKHCLTYTNKITIELLML